MTYTRNDKRLEAVAGVDSDSYGAKLWLARYDAIRAFDGPALTLREEPRPPFVVDDAPSPAATPAPADPPWLEQCRAAVLEPIIGNDLPLADQMELLRKVLAFEAAQPPSDEEIRRVSLLLAERFDSPTTDTIAKKCLIAAAKARAGR
jgi:hypothetical protein